MLNNTDYNYLLEHIPFYPKMTPAQLDLIKNSSSLVHYSKDQILHSGETNCVGLLVVKSGTIRIYITSEEGREVTLYRLVSGETCILSASCILESIHFDVNIVAESDCEIIQISSSLFSKLSKDNIYVELFTYKLATERFSDVMWTMQEILFTKFDKRLATFLLDESLRLGSDTINMTHEQIAKYLGSAREVVSRMLKYFSSEGLVSLSRGGIQIIDKKKLRTLI